MKHAYLILAHSDFEVLKLLVSQLDDARNDIYIHFDKKVKSLPTLVTRESGLYILEKRADVRWGHVSLIEAEYLLFESAFRNGPYSYYHMISGTHLPLANQDRIHDFFDRISGANVFVDLCSDSCYQETLKVRRINLFLRNFASRNKFMSTFSQFLWKSCIYIQKKLGIEINKDCKFLKASEWAHLTQPAIELLLERKRQVLKRYKFAFCSDEYFVPSELLNSHLSETMVNRDDVLYLEMGRSNPRTFLVSEWDSMKGNGFLFARKFKI